MVMDDFLLINLNMLQLALFVGVNSHKCVNMIHSSRAAVFSMNSF